MAAQYFNRTRLKEALRRDFPFHNTFRDGYVGYGRKKLEWTADELHNMGLKSADQFTEITPEQAELPLDNDIRRVRYIAETTIGVKYFYNNLSPVRQEAVLNLLFDYNLEDWEEITIPMHFFVESIRHAERNEVVYDIQAKFFERQDTSENKDNPRWKRLAAVTRSGDEADLDLATTYDSVSNVNAEAETLGNNVLTNTPIETQLNDALVLNPELQELQESVLKEIKSVASVKAALGELGITGNAVESIEDAVRAIGFEDAEEFKNSFKKVRKALRKAGINNRKDFRKAAKTLKSLLEGFVDDDDEDE